MGTTGRSTCYLVRTDAVCTAVHGAAGGTTMRCSSAGSRRPKRGQGERSCLAPGEVPFARTLPAVLLPAVQRATATVSAMISRRCQKCSPPARETGIVRRPAAVTTTARHASGRCTADWASTPRTSRPRKPARGSSQRYRAQPAGPAAARLARPADGRPQARSRPISESRSRLRRTRNLPGERFHPVAEPDANSPEAAE